MTPGLTPIAVAGMALAFAAHPGAERPAKSPFGWLAGLAGHCWQAESPPTAGRLEACWSLDATTQVLGLRTRDASGITVSSTIRLHRGEMVLLAPGQDGMPGAQCRLIPATPGIDRGLPRPGAVDCQVADLRSSDASQARLTYRLEPLGPDHYRVIAIYDHGGAAQAVSYRSWLFVRSGAGAARVDQDQKGTGRSGGVAAAVAPPHDGP